MSKRGSDEISPYFQDLHAIWIEVPDLESASIFFTSILEYEVASSGQTFDEMNALSLSAGHRRWTYLRAFGEQHGGVILFEGRGRPTALGLPRGWDSIEIVTTQVDAIAKKISKFPDVTTLINPFIADFSHVGSNVHRSGLWLMPWGNHVMLTQAVTQPAGREFPQAAAATGRVFEVHLRTNKYATERSLYLDLLCMPILMDLELASGPFHEAWNLANDHLVRMVFLKSGGAGTGGGAVELQGHPNEKLHPSNDLVANGKRSTPGGTALVTFSCHNLDSLWQVFNQANRFAFSPITTIQTGPMTGFRSFIIWGAEDEALECIEIESR